MLKTELHTHTSDDPSDRIPYDNQTLISRAAELGYQVLAITLHDRQLDIAPLRSYARERGVTLIPGVERTIRGKHVLLLNFPQAAESVSDFDQLRTLKARTNGLVIAPHPFFPTGSCLGPLLDTYADLFDALEINAFYTAAIDFNQRARRWAAARGRPLVGNGDVHRLTQLGTTYSLIDAEPDAGAVCEAVRRGQVVVESRPVSLAAATGLMASMMAAGLWPRERRTELSPTVTVSVP